MLNRKLLTVLIFLLCLVVVRGLIYGLLIPADQFPDELRHFKLIKSKQLALHHADKQEKMDIAARIAYAIYYMQNPDTTRQRSLNEFKGTKLPAPPSSFDISAGPVYYLITAWLLDVFLFEDIRSDFYAIRGSSIIWGMIVVLLSFMIARELFSDNMFIIVGTPVLITFIPQFAAMNGAINNDKLAELFTALAFFLMVKLLKNGLAGKQLLMLICLLGVIGLAILSKRSSFFMFPVLLVFVVVYWWRTAPGVKMYIVLIVMYMGIVLSAYVFMKNVGAIEQFVQEHIIWAPAYKFKNFLFRPELYTLDAFKQYLKFFTVMYWSFWGVFGYMTIHLHHFWYVAAAFVQLFAICGLTRFVWQIKKKKILLERWKVKSLHLFAISIFWAVILPFFRSNVLRPGNAILSQGRYLFPVIIPISLLTVVGLFYIIPSKFHQVAGTLCILALLLLDSACLANYILLNFHLVSLF